ncbi:MAG: DUF2314 domain-containing protein [Deltaproteobacteria bacterium]|nr:DUF2314 domain-containing protein [Deltaproteobacteria bacterium]
MSNYSNRSGRSDIFQAPTGDAMDAAYARARASFKYCWRELSWEMRRIVPGLDVSAVKFAFSDDGDFMGPDVEHMWLADVGFDGEHVYGRLLNTPGHLRSVSAGDAIRRPLAELEDWLYATGGKAYGGYTIDLMRQSMEPADRQGHDQAWGLDFGEPGTVEVVYFEGGPDQEHPMSQNMGPKLRELLTKDPSIATSADDHGWTQLHQMALAGSLAAVDLLLEFGADRSARNREGRTALELAEMVGWGAVVERLRQG